MNDLKHCCGQPPRLISKAGYGYSLVCMSCGLGVMDDGPSPTYQSAAHDWDNKTRSWYPKPHGPAKILLKELTDAHDVLRNLACILGVGGHNALEVDAYVFSKKITDGIDMLTAPLEQRIRDLEAEKEALLGRVADEVLAGWRKEDQEQKNPQMIVTTVVVGFSRYELMRSGYVKITEIPDGISRVQHISSVRLTVQQALEESLRDKKYKSAIGAFANL